MMESSSDIKKPCQKADCGTGGKAVDCGAGIPYRCQF